MGEIYVEDIFPFSFLRFLVMLCREYASCFVDSHCGAYFKFRVSNSGYASQFFWFRKSIVLFRKFSFGVNNCQRKGAKTLDLSSVWFFFTNRIVSRIEFSETSRPGTFSILSPILKSSHVCFHKILFSKA